MSLRAALSSRYSTRRRAVASDKVAGRFAARPLLSLALLFWCNSSAVAGSVVKVYEWRDAQGVMSYSQRPPPPGARDATRREIDIRSFTPAQQAAAKAYLSGLDAAELADAKRFRLRIDAADKAVDRALRALHSAERAFRRGRAPLPGERVGNAGGGSRLRSAYFARLKQSELDVERARARLSAAYRARSRIAP